MGGALTNGLSKTCFLRGLSVRTRLLRWASKWAFDMGFTDGLLTWVSKAFLNVFVVGV